MQEPLILVRPKAAPLDPPFSVQEFNTLTGAPSESFHIVRQIFDLKLIKPREEVISFKILLFPKLSSTDWFNMSKTT